MRKLMGIAIVVTSCALSAVADETTGGGFIVNDEERTLQAELPGMLHEMLVDEGQFVEAGQVLARMRSYDLERRMQRATAQVKLALIDLQIAEARVNGPDIQQEPRAATEGRSQNRNEEQSEREMKFSIAELELQRAKASLEATQEFRVLLQRQMERLLVRAPIDGRISVVHAEAGDVIVRRGSPLLTVCVREELAAHVRFPAKAITLLHQERPNGGGPLVTMRIEALDKALEGHVTRVARSVDPSSQTLQTTVRFDNDDLSFVRPGMKVTAEIRPAN